MKWTWNINEKNKKNITVVISVSISESPRARDLYHWTGRPWLWYTSFLCWLPPPHTATTGGHPLQSSTTKTVTHFRVSWFFEKSLGDTKISGIFGNCESRESLGLGCWQGFSFTFPQIHAAALPQRSFIHDDPIFKRGAVQQKRTFGVWTHFQPNEGFSFTSKAKSTTWIPHIPTMKCNPCHGVFSLPSLKFFPIPPKRQCCLFRPLLHHLCQENDEIWGTVFVPTDRVSTSVVRKAAFYFIWLHCRLPVYGRRLAFVHPWGAHATTADCGWRQFYRTFPFSTVGRKFITALWMFSRQTLFQLLHSLIVHVGGRSHLNRLPFSLNKTVWRHPKSDRVAISVTTRHGSQELSWHNRPSTITAQQCTCPMRHFHHLTTSLVTYHPYSWMDTRLPVTYHHKEPQPLEALWYEANSPWGVRISMEETKKTSFWLYQTEKKVQTAAREWNRAENREIAIPSGLHNEKKKGAPPQVNGWLVVTKALLEARRLPIKKHFSVATPSVLVKCVSGSIHSWMSVLRNDHWGRLRGEYSLNHTVWRAWLCVCVCGNQSAWPIWIIDRDRLDSFFNLVTGRLTLKDAGLSLKWEPWLGIIGKKLDSGVPMEQLWLSDHCKINFHRNIPSCLLP